MTNIYEVNMLNPVADIDTGRIGPKSPIVEIFSALTQGNDRDLKFDGKTIDKAVNTIKELCSKVLAGDTVARSEMNTIVRFAIEPQLLQAVRIFDFMGTYHKIGYQEQPMMKIHKYEDIESRFQASSSDVPFGTHNFEEYPIGTQTISAGLAFDYREIQSGNFDGTVAEGMRQVQIDMYNKCVYYVMMALYNGIKTARNEGRITHFVEQAGVVKTAVDDLLKTMKRYGKVNICGDYSVVSEFNNFDGYKTFATNAIPFGDSKVAEEIRMNGLVNYYNGAHVTELPNSINFTRLNADGTDYSLYMPEGLLFFIPQGSPSPLQVFLRGGLTSMSGNDIVTRKEMIRFDMELGAGIAKTMEHYIGLMVDLDYDLPDVFLK